MRPNLIPDRRPIFAGFGRTVAWLVWLVTWGTSVPAASPEAPPSVNEFESIGTCRLEEVSPDPTVTRTPPAVLIHRSGDPRPLVAQRGDLLRPGDTLETFPAGTATIRTSGGGQLRLAENSRLRVLASGRERSFIGYLALGAARFLGFLPDDTLVQTPNGIAASHHTEYEIVVRDDGSTAVKAFDGQVAFTNAGAGLILDPNGISQAVALRGRAPVPMLRATQIVQWWIHYPVVLCVDELETELAPAFRPSLEAYRSGRLRDAVRLLPAVEFTHDSERLYAAALRLVVGDLSGAEALLAEVTPGDEIARASRDLLGVAQGRTVDSPGEPTTATGWLARSYVEQARHRLAEAHTAAVRAVTLGEVGRRFGAGWLRLAELELGREAWTRAREAVREGRRWSPENAQGAALEGFLGLGEHRVEAALASFEDALRLDSSLANGWFGRALCRFRQHAAGDGIRDLETAVALEPERSMLRSYLGKAFAYEGRWADAHLQLERARELDPADPTPWLYAAIFDRERYRIRPAITNLARSIQLNDHRQLFRSRSQLDQDESMRRANLAFLYREAGLTEWSRWEAARAVANEYGNPDAHLFLAQSYYALADPYRATLRYEAAIAGEFLIANLLAPVAVAQLSPQSAYARPATFFAGREWETFATVTATDPGGLRSRVSQQGHLDGTAYAVDYEYSALDRGAPNTRLEQHVATTAVKQQLGPEDSVFLLLQGTSAEGGDLRPYRDPTDADTSFRFSEDQWPNLLLGLNHQWQAGQKTLVLLGRLTDDFAYAQALRPFPLLQSFDGGPPLHSQATFGIDASTQFDLLSAELQHLADHGGGTLVAGFRFQGGEFLSGVRLREVSEGTMGLLPKGSFVQETDTDLRRWSGYLYDQLALGDTWHVTLGLAYDDVEYPLNGTAPPFDSETERTSALAPKAGLAWSPRRGTVLRGAYSRSLGGFSFDGSVRLEPTQVEGFLQSYRSLAPEGDVGVVPGTTFEIWGFALTQEWAQRWYLTTYFEERSSRANPATGGFVAEVDDDVVVSRATLARSVRYDESHAGLHLDLLAGRDVSLGWRYGFVHARSKERTTSPWKSAPVISENHRDVYTHEFGLTGRWQHPSGFFAKAAALGLVQIDAGPAPAWPDEWTFQIDLGLGFRFPRRSAEISFGVINLTSEAHALSPLGVIDSLPRGRVLAVNSTFAFW